MRIDVPSRYHPALVALHWLLALMIIVSLVVGAVVLAPAENVPEKIFGLRIHVIVGISILVLMIVRIGVRMATPTPPRAATGNAWLDRVARGVHFLLYLGVVLLAASGITLAVQSNLGEALFFGQGALPADFWAYRARTAHYALSRLVMVLLLVHVAGALYHRFVLRDHVLARMWFAR